MVEKLQARLLVACPAILSNLMLLDVERRLASGDLIENRKTRIDKPSSSEQHTKVNKEGPQGALELATARGYLRASAVVSLPRYT